MGAEVCLVGRNVNSLQKLKKQILARGDKVSTYVWDISNVKAVSKHIKNIKSELGGLDIWVNNAGVYIDSENGFSESEWDVVMDTDCRSLYFIMEDLTKAMQGAKGENCSFFSIRCGKLYRGTDNCL